MNQQSKNYSVMDLMRDIAPHSREERESGELELVIDESQVSLSEALHRNNLWYMDVADEKALNRANYRRRHSPKAGQRRYRRQAHARA